MYLAGPAVMAGKEDGHEYGRVRETRNRRESTGRVKKELVPSIGGKVRWRRRLFMAVFALEHPAIC